MHKRKKYIVLSVMVLIAKRYDVESLMARVSALKELKKMVVVGVLDFTCVRVEAKLME